MFKNYEQLVYKFKLLQKWKINSVLSVTMLKSTFKKTNFYKRFRKEKLNSVLKIKKQKKLKDTYEIKKLLNRKKIEKEKKKRIKFLVKWKEWSLVHNKWYDVIDLKNIKEAIIDYENKYEKRFRRKYEKV